MKSLKYILVFVAAIILAACQKYDADIDSLGKEIELWASTPLSSSLIVSANSAKTRAGGTPGDNIITSITDKTFPIGMLRLDEMEGTGYPMFTYEPEFVPSAPLLAELGKPDAGNSNLREIQFTSAAQFYRNSSREIKFAAWYPWKNNDADYKFNSGEDATNVTIPIDGATDILYGSIATGSMNTGFNVMEFNHALCVYRIYAYAMFVDNEKDEDVNTAYAWGELEEMSIQNVSKNVILTLPKGVFGASDYDKYTVDYSNGEGNMQTLDLHDANNNIYFEPGGELPFGVANRRLVAVCIAPPPVSSEQVLDIQLKTSKAQTTQKVSIARNFQAGHAYDIVLRFSAHGIINATVSVGDWNLDEPNIYNGSSSIYYNLSRYGTSNCYEINSGNYNYCFDGTVKGNGNGASVGVTDVSLNPGYVDILWSDIPGQGEGFANGEWEFKMDASGRKERKQLFELVSNYLSNGKVLLHVNGDYTEDITKTPLKTEGNVIIAAYDKKPEYAEDGKTIINGAAIIWTWHLWLTDAVKDVGNNNGIIIQDRNLGAISSAPASYGTRDYSMYGLWYQWGRPTPFNLINYTKSTDENADSDLPETGITIPNSTVTANRTNEPAATAQEAISHPLTLYGIGTQNDWVSDKTNFVKFWGWAANYEDAEKTIYDPCPYGYKVPGYRLWSGISAYEYTGTSGGYNSESGARLSFGGSSTDEHFYLPATGYFTSKGDYKDNTMSFIWSYAHVGGTGEDKNYIYTLAYNADDKAHTIKSESSTEPTQVRCISRRSYAVVTDLSDSQTSNCYMVNAPGYYKFKATVRGNGLGSLLPIGGSTTVEIHYGVNPNIDPNEIAKIVPLWWQGDMSSESFSTDKGDPGKDNNLSYMSISDDKIDKNGYFTFYVDRLAKGNLILAAYNPEGVILWTWHIWFTDKPADKRSGNYALMDRFLGATFAPAIGAGSVNFNNDNERLATYGFYYQWGRKDPLVGPPGVSSGSESVSGSNSRSSVYWVYDHNNNTWSEKNSIELDGSRPGVAAVVKAPMKFYYGSAQALDGGQWIAPSERDGRTNTAMWGYAVEGYDTGQSFSKTMWDPCPPGYRTPLHHVWYYSSTYSYAGAENQGEVRLSNELDFDAEGRGMVTNKNYFDKMWYPFAGYRSPTTGGYVDVGSDGYMLSGMPMGGYNTRSFYYYNNRSGQACNSGNGGRGPAFGMPVRCMKE